MPFLYFYFLNGKQKITLDLLNHSFINLGKFLYFDEKSVDWLNFITSWGIKNFNHRSFFAAYWF